jgi:hypothetical protein
MADHALPGVQRCALESLAAARASSDFPGPHGNLTWIIRWPDELPPADEAVARAVRGVAGHILEGEPRVPYPTGLTALAGLETAVAAWDGLDEGDLKDRLRRLWFCVEKAGTGGGLFRGLWAEGLERFAELLGDPALDRLAALYRDLAAEWSEAAAEGLRRDRREALQAVGARVARIVRLEEEGARDLAAWSRSRLNDTQATGEGR